MQKTARNLDNSPMRKQEFQEALEIVTEALKSKLNILLNAEC